MGSITTRWYPDDGERVTKGDMELVSDLLAGDCRLVWVDIDDPSKGDLQRLAH